MKCQSQISVFCLKKFSKEKVKYINNMNVCEKCYWKLKRENKKNE